MIDNPYKMQATCELFDTDKDAKVNTKSIASTKKSKRKLRRQNKLNGKRWSKY